VRPLESSALALVPTCIGDKFIMPYDQRLQPWVVVLLLPKMQRVDVARFHNFSDAEGYAQVMRRLNPDRTYEVMFDPSEGDRTILR